MPLARRLQFPVTRDGDGLPYPLVRPSHIDVGAVRAKHAAQLALVQDEEMVEALAPDAAEEAFAGGIRACRPEGRRLA